MLKMYLKNEIRVNEMDFLKHINPGINTISSYDPGKSISDVLEKHDLDKIIKLSSNENSRGPSPKVLDVTHTYNNWHLYPDGDGKRLKSTISDLEEIEPDRIVLGNGSNEILELVGQTFLSPKAESIFSAHAFAVYKLVSQVRGCKYHEIPTKDWGHDLDEFLNHINEKTRVIFIANPNNPTGTYLSHNQIERFLNKVPSNIVVVIDLAYFEYVVADDYVRPDEITKNFSNVIITKSFSKIYGLSSMRVGYGYGSRELIEILNRVRQPFNVNGLAQESAIAAIQDAEYIEESIKINADGRYFVCQSLKAMNIDFIPSQGNFVCIETKIGGSNIFNALLEEGVIVRSLDLYTMPRHIRVTIGSEEENKFFIEKLDKVISS